MLFTDGPLEPRIESADVTLPVSVSDVPVAAPITGVTSVGVFANTSDPVPVSSEMTPANSEDVVAARAESLSVVTTRVLLVGIVVPFTDVAVATPRLGVVRLGEVAKTSAPLPVSSEITPAS